MNRFAAAALAAVLVLGGCERPAGLQEGPFTLTFTGDASMVAAHGGRPFAAAVVRTSTGEVVARASGAIEAGGASAFDVTFPDVLEVGELYEVAYWIDGNVGGGGVGACDPPEIDYQGRVAVPVARRHVSVEIGHDPAGVAAACDAFTVDLTVSLGADFQEPHGGHDVVLRLVDAGLDALRAQHAGQISATASPAFEHTFEAALVVGRSYVLDVWIDSDIGGGTPGVCDPPANDHQWRIALGVAPDTDVDRVLPYTPETMTAVCPAVEISAARRPAAARTAAAGRGRDPRPGRG